MKYNCHVDKIILLTEHNPEGHHEVPRNKMGQGLRKDRWPKNKSRILSGFISECDQIRDAAMDQCPASLSNYNFPRIT